jgi:hypothetical protein
LSLALASLAPRCEHWEYVEGVPAVRRDAAGRMSDELVIRTVKVTPLMPRLVEFRRWYRLRGGAA